MYRAFDPRLERTVALKLIIAPESAKTPAKGTERESGSSLVELSGRMLREARAVASLSHPNVVAIYDVGESDGRLYLAMEYVVGSSLRNLVGNVELPLSRRLCWLIDVARALEAAHKAGIVHRDIKPENVMIREDGGVKVLDFGIARRTMSLSPPEEQHAVDTVTGGGAIAGTPVYMAPEQIKGADVDARSDQFAWAVMAYEGHHRRAPVGRDGRRPQPRRPHPHGSAAVDPLEDEDVLSVVEETVDARPREGFLRSGFLLWPTSPTPSSRSRRSRPEAIAFASPRTHARTTIRHTRPRHVCRRPSLVEPTPSDARTTVPETPRRRAFALALPLVLLGALATTVYVVKSRNDGHTRPAVPAVPGVPGVTSSTTGRPAAPALDRPAGGDGLQGGDEPLARRRDRQGADRAGRAHPARSPPPSQLRTSSSRSSMRRRTILWLRRPPSRARTSIVTCSCRATSACSRRASPTYA